VAAIPAAVVTPQLHTEARWVCDLDEVNVVLGAEGLDEFDVLGL
jgi:hypothetical protein